MLNTTIHYGAGVNTLTADGLVFDRNTIRILPEGNGLPADHPVGG